MAGQLVEFRRPFPTQLHLVDLVQAGSAFALALPLQSGYSSCCVVSAEERPLVVGHQHDRMAQDSCFVSESRLVVQG